METLTAPFVRRATVSFGRGHSGSVDNPTWPEVELILHESSERGGRVDLQSDDETEMTVFAENGTFHVTVSVGETDYYFASDGSEPTEETQDIFGHSFNRHQVIKNLASVADVAKTWWATGERSESMLWLHETLDV